MKFRFIAFFLMMIFFAQDLMAMNEKEMLKEIRFEQKIGAKLDGHTSFIDEHQQRRELGSLLGTRPSIFVFTYAHCKTLCPLIVDELSKDLTKVNQIAGKDYQVLFLSLNPDEKQSDIIERINHLKNKQGFHFLRGEKKDIDLAAHELGFHYKYVDETKEYAHPAGIVFLTPKGVVSSYLMGMTYPPGAIDSALRIAGKNERGSLVESLLLYCFHYNPLNGKYGAIIMNSLKIAALATCFAMALGLYKLNRKSA